MEPTNEEKMANLHIDYHILESIKHSQMQHGLKYENYRNYRTYCSRRLHRIRRSLNVHQGVAPSVKARHQRARKLMDVNNMMVLEAGEKEQEYAERVLIIPLCLAERAWACAMQLKQEVGDHPRKRYHMVRRMRKAAKFASKFEALCHDPESPCSDWTKQEATAYASYINGIYKFEREEWAESKENLSKALSIYFTLSLSIKKEEVLEHYRQRIDEIRASLKYCAFNLDDKGLDIKVKLPSTLQFHDLAFRHAKKLQESVPQAKAATATPVKPSNEEEDEDEFEETRDDIGNDDDEVSHDEEEEDDDEQEEDNKQERPGGVTGFVKGWLGGAWSK